MPKLDERIIENKDGKWFDRGSYLELFEASPAFIAQQERQKQIDAGISADTVEDTILRTLARIEEKIDVILGLGGVK